ncbi:polysaccharide biosynthesis tyrosine autokinase [Patescibacteria group bacterium]|nr:polysaccharide biosynthesis tyrosine autokinase [Patescibacteria group bacterium]
MNRKKNSQDKKSSARLIHWLGDFPVRSHFAESYRTLRTNIQFSSMEENLKSFMVTSAIEQEGKSTTVVNLAYTMVQAGNSVLIVDADLRKPKLGELFDLKHSKGLSDFLAEALMVNIQSGSLDEFSLSDLFLLISFSKKSGILHLRSGNERVDIHFLRGAPQEVSWVTRPTEKKLAILLVNSRMLTAEQIKHALIKAQNTGQKLGFVLINMGLVKENDLAGFIVLHVIEGLRTALQFKEGEFSFVSHPRSGMKRPAFQPADLNDLYSQSLIGEEEFPYLKKMIGSCVVKTPTDNLFLLPTGYIPPNPTELLSSRQMSFLLTLLEKRFDILVIDTPPVMPASDALLLAPQTDGVLLVVRAGRTNREIIRKAVEQIKVTQANIIGVVLNEVDTRRDRYYSSKYYPSYYYGEGEDKHRSPS